jgi:hypothetical protein
MKFFYKKVIFCRESCVGLGFLAQNCVSSDKVAIMREGTCAVLPRTGARSKISACDVCAAMNERMDASLTPRCTLTLLTTGTLLNMFDSLFSPYRKTLDRLSADALTIGDLPPGKTTLSYVTHSVVFGPANSRLERGASLSFYALILQISAVTITLQNTFILAVVQIFKQTHNQLGLTDEGWWIPVVNEQDPTSPTASRASTPARPPGTLLPCEYLHTEIHPLEELSTDMSSTTTTSMCICLKYLDRPTMSRRIEPMMTVVVFCLYDFTRISHGFSQFTGHYCNLENTFRRC